MHPARPSFEDVGAGQESLSHEMVMKWKIQSLLSKLWSRSWPNIQKSRFWKRSSLM